MKSNKLRVGIIGNGFVGEAIAFAFSPVFEVLIYDKDPNKSTHKIEDVNECDFVFVCVPTPMDNNGEQDLSFVEDVFYKSTEKPIYILKSTVLPGTTNNLLNKYPYLKLIFSPEFLTERTSKIDMLTQSRIVLGGKENLINQVEKIFVKRFNNKKIIKTDSVTAELIKYMNNTFFATKISIMNEFKLLCDSVGANWEESVIGFVSDGRVADSHIDVPGHDGKLGYGGTCFPKDVSSLINFAKKYSINLNTIKGGWETNLQLRNDKDWEKKIGRSVNFKNKKHL